MPPSGLDVGRHTDAFIQIIPSHDVHQRKGFPSEQTKMSPNKVLDEQQSALLSIAH